MLKVSLPCGRLMNLGTPCPRDESARFGGRLSRLGCRKNVTYADPVPIGPDAPQTARNRGGVPLRCNGTASTPLRSHPFIPALRAKSLIPIAGRGCLITGRASCGVFRLAPRWRALIPASFIQRRLSPISRAGGKPATGSSSTRAPDDESHGCAATSSCG